MEFVIWMLVTVVTIIPMVKLLPHFGIHKYWAAFCVIPVGVLILLWVMALRLQEMEKR